ncbi:DUF1707 SHOCT-like domain-containing protein [Nocardioides sp.]|uniref:DUF1707 SHOCT-like domain-containing protein n=1 Tax=Nocardioides sp. TaxID=35761 RepID=UPI003D1140F8
MSHAFHSMRGQVHDAWPALNSWQTQLTKGNVRIGDAERDDAIRALGEHFAAGRLDREEYDERADAALAARTWSDVAPLFRDLPQPVATPRAPVPVSPRPRARLPFLPVLLILIGVSWLVGMPWLVWVGIGMFLLFRRAAWARRRQTSGSWRPPRGSWS